MGCFAVYANIILRIGRETALQSELINIRMSIEHYQMLNNKYPQSLGVLLNNGLTRGSFDAKISTIRFLEPFRIDNSGSLLDPFFNKYIYNNENGLVHSQTRGYERW